MLNSVLTRLDATLERTPKLALLFLSLFAAVLLGIAAYFVTTDLLILYLGPIFLASWYAGWRSGLVVAVYAAVAAFVVETIQLGGEFHPELLATLAVRLAALFHDLGKPTVGWRGTDGRLHYYAKPGFADRGHDRVGADLAAGALLRLRYPNALRKRVVRIVRRHMFQPGKGDARRARRFLRRNGDELAFELIDHKHADLLGKRGTGGEPPPQAEIDALARFRAVVKQELSSPHRLRDLAVDGNDLIKLGFQPGPQLGRILHDLLDAVVDEPALNTRDQLLERARKRL